MKKPGADIKHELERAIFRSLYDSGKQRLLRLSSIGLIATKHGLRGLLYVWPLTLLIFVELPGYWSWLKLILISLAAAGWLRFVYRSVKEDYGRFVLGKLLELSKIFKVL